MLCIFTCLSRGLGRCTLRERPDFMITINYWKNKLDSIYSVATRFCFQFRLARLYCVSTFELNFTDTIYLLRRTIGCESSLVFCC